MRESATNPTRVSVSLTAMRPRTNSSGPVILGIIARIARGRPGRGHFVRLTIFWSLGIPKPVLPITPFEEAADEAAHDVAPAARCRAGRARRVEPPRPGAGQGARAVPHRGEPDLRPRRAEGQGRPALRADRHEQRPEEVDRG